MKKSSGFVAGRMFSLLVAGWLMAVPLVSNGAERWMPYRVVTPDELDLSRLSEIGRDMLKNPDDWLIGRSEHFLVFGKSRPHVSAAVDEAENVLIQASEWLGLAYASAEPPLLVFIQDERQWEKLVRLHGVRHDGLALQVDREMYFKDDPELRKRPDRVAHEVMHFLVAVNFPSGLPLWLEEGLAIHYGWQSAVRMNQQRGLAIYRELPPLDDERMLDLESLAGLKRYPIGVEEARAFFIQSEELVAVLAGRLGPEGMANLVRELGVRDGGSIEQIREAAGLDEEGLSAVEDEARRRCLESRTR